MAAHLVLADAVIQEPMNVLTRRERDVMNGVARGLTNARIADELQISTHAVKFHLASVYRKLGMRNRTEATAWYVTERAREAAG